MRSEFERIVDANVGPTLAEYGFALAPQPPGDLEEPRPRAIYEALPETFDATLPGIAAHWDVEADCIDLTIEGDPRAALTVSLEGDEFVSAPLSSLPAVLARALADNA
jgi:hypothetical protein